MPTKANLNYRVPAPGPSPTLAHGFESSGSGLRSIGTAMMEFGMQEKQKDDALDVINAEAEHRKGLNEIQRDLMNDNDYTTFDQRFGERAQPLAERSAALIRDDSVRQRWLARSQMEAEGTRNHILNHGMALKRQDQAIQLEDALSSHAAIAADTSSTAEQRQAAMDAMKQSIEVARRSGMVSPSRARKLFKDYATVAHESSIHARIASGEDIETIIKDINRSSTKGASPLTITGKLETGKDDLLVGIGNISGDSRGTKSYGNLGLNSGGSVQEFVKNYGKEFGLTAKPGTKEFDDQWRIASRTTPVELHAKEVEWYQDTILSRVEGDLVKAGASEDVAADPRVQAYFADRMIQYGPNSTLNHKDRVARAAKDFGNDPESFLRAMSAIDRQNLPNDFVSAIATVPRNERERSRYIGGLGNRIANRESMSLAIDEGTPDGPYPFLGPKDRSRLMNVAKIAYREQAKQEIDNAIKRLRDSGTPPVDIKGRSILEKIKPVVTENQYQQYKFDLIEAGANHVAVKKLDGMSESEGNEWIDRLNPANHDKSRAYPIEGLNPDEHYAITSRVHDRAERAWLKMRKQRDDDPGSIDSQEVRDAKAAIAKQAGKITPTQAMELIIDARLATQAKLGISEGLRSPITKREAQDLLRIPRGANADEVELAITDAVGRAKATYGKHAEAAMRAAISLHLKDKKERQAARDIAEIGFAPPPKPKDDRSRMESVFDWLVPERAEQLHKIPNDAQIDWVLADPEARKATFDTKFGAGATARYIAERAKGKSK